MKTCGYFALALVMMAPGAAFGADAKTEYYQRAAQRDVATFRALDRNEDRAVTRLEAHGDVDFVPRFDDMDINRDGFVTLEELQRYIERQYGVRAAG